MIEKNPNRESYFPAIEKKYGQPMSYWFDQMDEIADQKYPEQIAHLKESHGFSQAHANALVMYSRGSKTSRRFNTVNDYFAQFDGVRVKTAKEIFKAIWNKDVLEKFAPRLKNYEVNKKTIRVPVDWKVDSKLASSPSNRHPLIRKPGSHQYALLLLRRI
jgi:hypothetical protein